MCLMLRRVRSKPPIGGCNRCFGGYELVNSEFFDNNNCEAKAPQLLYTHYVILSEVKNLGQRRAQKYFY